MLASSGTNNIGKVSRFSKIIGIQMGVLSPDDIRKGSVALITSRDTYENNVPVVGGLFDLRMGVSEDGMLCITDGLKNVNTPGYHGHIELVRPVFYIQFLEQVIKVLSCVCLKCSKLLCEKNKKIMKMPDDARLSAVCQACDKVKRCGDDTEHGCGYLKPLKIKKEQIASLYAEWKPTTNANQQIENNVLRLTAEEVLKIFTRICDEDVHYMGFSPKFSRPEWFIAQTLLVSPPAVRPSVKNDAQQRSEDDLTHVLMHIIKCNSMLQEKINKNASQQSIDDITNLLQLYVAVQVNNSIPNVPPVAHRSGRPFKSVADRISGKQGRLRSNLLAKRVDYSARSVITADPKLSIREVGVPLQIAIKLTIPVTVNKLNYKFLKYCVLNGADKYPGAKMISPKNATDDSDNIMLSYYMDRESIKLNYGDVVHRHLIDGDYVLFNRQPSLHKMSMMGHCVRVMFEGKTIRFNVADTACYNADFDGDEMNFHVPQDIQSMVELMRLAAVEYQLISPAKNGTIVGIFQDSMLGSYLFTQKLIWFSKKQAMKLLMSCDTLNLQMFLDSFKDDKISNFDILSQIMPPLTAKYKNSMYNDATDNMKTSNNVVEINNGIYKRGQITKAVVSSTSKGLLHRICSGFSHARAVEFIDNLQSIINNYLELRSFSVGISDLLSTKNVSNSVVDLVTNKKKDVQDLLNQVQIGVFINNTGKSNKEEMEMQIMNKLNQASSEAGKIVISNLIKDNNLWAMSESGAKGSTINICLMKAVVGQQSVNGGRISYGFEDRTLPHFTKYDDSPSARGFIENSYFNGLSPSDVFFHAIAGRIGLIDTAVKTSQTGYIQRRLIKGHEDLMVYYDLTVRAANYDIIQFSYGDDNINTTFTENQQIPITQMTIGEIYAHYITEETPQLMKQIFTKSAYSLYSKQKHEYHERIKPYIDFIIDVRPILIRNVFKNKNESSVVAPIMLQSIIDNVQGQCEINAYSVTDMTLIECLDMIEYYYAKIQNIYYAQPTKLFKLLYYYYLSPINIVIVRRFNKKAMMFLMESILYKYKQSIIPAGDMVGIVAAQSIGEVSTQMTLNTFHFAGVASKTNVTQGVPRLEELLSLTANIKNPSLSVFLKQNEETSKERATDIMNMLEYTALKDIIVSSAVCYDPDDLNTLILEDKETISQFKVFEQLMFDCAEISYTQQNKSHWIIRIEMDAEQMLNKNITMDDVQFCIKNYSEYALGIQDCIFSDYNANKLVFRFRFDKTALLQYQEGKKTTIKGLDLDDSSNILNKIQDGLINNVVMRGVPGIKKVNIRKISDCMEEHNGTYQKKDIWVLDTIGSNLIDVLALDYIDNTRTITNDVMEMYNVLGMEALRRSILEELNEAISAFAYINYHHYSILVDRMTFREHPIAIWRHGINNDSIGPLAKASFEQTPKILTDAAKQGELDIMRGVSANIIFGQKGYFGTSAFQVLLDTEYYLKLNEDSKFEYTDINEEIEKQLNPEETTPCSATNIAIQNNTANIQAEDIGMDNDYELGF